MMKMDANAEKELQDEMSPTEGYLRCLGQLRWSSEKLPSLVGEEGGQNPIHLKSAYTELIDTCDKVVAMLGDTKNLAIAGLHAVQRQTEDESEMLENNTLIEHDPARRPSILDRANQTSCNLSTKSCAYQEGKTELIFSNMV